MARFLAQVLAEFAAGLRFPALPERAVRVAKTGITDCIGVAIAGSGEAPVQMLQKALLAGRSAGQSTVLGGQRLRASAGDAAWINGTAGHVLDYDDIARGHPSVVIVPAVLAVAEEMDASGCDLITAYVVGYEVWMELMLRERGSYQEKGWHHTPLLGALAASAACANLQGLDPDRTTHAIGIAASQASGIVANHGTSMKSIQVGRAAHAAVMSVRLAQLGATAAPDALDHERGFLKAISPAGDVDVSTGAERLGNDWHICKYALSIKRYPVCYRAHRAIDAILDVAARAGIRASDVARLEVFIGELDATILAHHFPDSALKAKFSMEFAAACALIAGNVGLQQLDDAFVRRGDVRGLMRKVIVITNSDYDPEAPGFSMYDSVRIVLNSGETHQSANVRHARGHPQCPLSTEELRRKFTDCVDSARAGFDATGLLGALERLEELGSCRFMS